MSSGYTRQERVQMWVAWHLPKPIWKWATVRAFAAATTGIHGDRHPNHTGYDKVMEAIDGS